MTTPTASTASGDPRPERSRALILEAAAEHFARHGFLAANVDVLAGEAGVAKRTVYNLFGSKEELFRAVVRRSIVIAERFVSEYVSSPEEPETGPDDVAAALSDFAVTHARAVVNPHVIATRRLLIGEARRFPELATEYWQRVPGAVIRAIAARLQRYADTGAVRIDDAETAADHFVYLVLGAALDQALFEPDAIDVDLRDARARAGAAAFLRAYPHPTRGTQGRVQAPCCGSAARVGGATQSS